MSYTTISAVTGSAWQVSGENVDAAIVQQGINTADSIIDAYLGNRYTVPFSSTPALVRDMSIIIARYWCQLFASPHLQMQGEADKDAWEAAKEILKMVAKGEMALPGESITANDFVYSNTIGYTPVFDVDGELWWTADSDRLDDIDDARD